MSRRIPRACERAGEQRWGEAAMRRRAAEHTAECRRCRRDEDLLSDVVAPLARVATLDEVGSARLLHQIDARIAAQGRPGSRATGRFAPAWLDVVLLAGCAVLLAFAARGTGEDASPSAGDTHFEAAPRGLEIPAGAIVRARLGDAGRITLVGPASLRIARVDAAGLTVRVSAGRLLVDWDSTGGRELVIDSPGAITRVSGTLFAVEVVPEGTRVAVARGSVEVHDARGVVLVRTGEEWTSGQARSREISNDLARGLADHEGSAFPPSSVWGVLTVVDPSPAIPAPTVPPHPGPGVMGRADAAPARSSRRDRRGADAGMLDATPPLDGTPGAQPREQAAPEPPATPTPVATPFDAEAAYEEAERLLREGQRMAGRRRLLELIEHAPSDPLANVARYDLARLAHESGDLVEARRHLERFAAAGGDPVLDELAHRLRCRIEQSGSAVEAGACLVAFRRAFPDSPHDHEALAALAAIRLGDGCAAARALLEEYVRRYPKGAFAREAAERLQRCFPRGD